MADFEALWALVVDDSSLIFVKLGSTNRQNRLVIKSTFRSIFLFVLRPLLLVFVGDAFLAFYLDFQ